MTEHDAKVAKTLKMLELIEKMKSIRTLTVGDPMVDQYVFCTASRLCPEGPVPVLVPVEKKNSQGGAAHVCEQLVQLVGTSMNFYGNTSLKTRYMVGHHLVLRMDEDKGNSATDAQKIEALGKHFKETQGYHAIIISDYAKGFMTTAFTEWLVDYAGKNRIPVVVDPKGKNWDKYKGCTLICPNTHELKAQTEGNAVFQFLLLKCGAQGVSLYQPSGKLDFPATWHRVFDVTGAGDIIVAVAAAVLGVGGTMVQAAKLSNLAAGWSVGEVGTVVLTRDKLIELVQAAGADIE